MGLESGFHFFEFTAPPPSAAALVTLLSTVLDHYDFCTRFLSLSCCCCGSADVSFPSRNQLEQMKLKQKSHLFWQIMCHKVLRIEEEEIKKRCGVLNEIG